MRIWYFIFRFEFLLEPIKTAYNYKVEQQAFLILILNGLATRLLCYSHLSIDCLKFIFLKILIFVVRQEFLSILEFFVLLKSSNYSVIFTKYGFDRSMFLC